jgi:hypothetical protein
MTLLDINRLNSDKPQQSSGYHARWGEFSCHQ